MKLSETIDAAIKVAGTPLKVSGIFESAILARTPEKSTNANVNARPVPKALVIACEKLYPLSILAIVTPRTAQFVVINGR